MPNPPLSERVDAPAELQSAAVAGLAWRPATLDDVDHVFALSTAMSAADHPDWSEPREEIEELLTLSFVDVAHDTLIGEADGRVVAFGQALPPFEPETIVRSVLLGGVHPEFRGRGIGRSLLGWLEGRGRQQLAASGLTLPGWLMAYTQDHNPGGGRLFERAGFDTARYFAQLERTLDGDIPELELPTPLQLVNASLELSAATRDAKNAAFRDHWGSQPTPREAWDNFMAASTRRLDLSYLALEGDEVVGLVVLDVNEDDWPRQGYSSSYIALVGVVARWRRQGVAPALLAASLVASRNAGLDRIALDVDSENPTGALGLYTGMGFTTKDTSRAHVKAF
ncbi:MAG: GNAT family N-acetyltransferase [Pseudolysinimonas sp.]